MIILNHLQKKYSNKSVLKDINIAFNQSNTIYTIVGKSGSGKSTLFNILLGLDQTYNGEYLLNNENVRSYNHTKWSEVRSNQICTVFQDYKLLENLTVYDNLLYASTLNKEETVNRIQELLQTFNLEQEVNQKVHQLSGGQKQRLAIARAIFNYPNVLLMDEPTANLDEDNISDLKKYLQLIKKDMIIIMVTHDRDIASISDITYLLEDGKLVLISDQSTYQSFSPKDNNTINRIKPIQYLITYCKSKFLDLILLNIPIFLIFAIFINVFSYIQYDLKTGVYALYDGISEQTIFISTDNYSKDYIKEKKGYVLSDDGTRIRFSKDDLEQVKSISGVKDVKLFNTAISSIADHENLLSDYYFLKEDASATIKARSSYSKCPNTVSFAFNSLRVSDDFFDYYNPDGIQLFMGRVPKSNTNEILIPDILSYQLFNNIVEDDQCTLSVRDNMGNQKYKNYQIVGVYSTNSHIFIEPQYIIYTGYDDYDPIELNSTLDSYNYMKNFDIEENKAIKGYTNPIYESFDSFQKAMGTCFSDMIIVAENSQVVKVQNEVKKLFPNLSIVSQEEIKNGESGEIINNVKHIHLLLQIGAIILFSIIVLLLSRNYIKGRTKEIAILYMLGYNKCFIYTLLLLEYLFTTLINMIGAYVLIYIARFFFKGSTILMVLNYIFTFKMILSMTFSIIGIMLLSVIISVMQIKEDKLINHLKEIQ